MSRNIRKHKKHNSVTKQIKLFLEKHHKFRQKLLTLKVVPYYYINKI